MTLAQLLRDDPEPERLIRAYTPTVLRSVPAYQRRFPGQDVEPALFQALYLAAYTYRPGRQGFYRWYRIKLRGQWPNFRRWHQRRADAGVSFGPLHNPSMVDRRYFYRSTVECES